MTLFRTSSVTCLLFAAISVSCNSTPTEADKPAGTSTPAPAAWNVTIQPLEMPTGARSAQPQLTTSTRGAVASWLELSDTGATLRFAERSNAGWSAPQTIASDNNWFISDADVPAVMRMRDGTLVASWYPAVDFRLEAYDIRLSYSKDEGKTWARPIVPHHDGTRTQHGFVSMFEMPSGGLGLVWLDGRDQGKQPEDAEMAHVLRQLRQRMEADRGGLVNPRVCECCTDVRGRHR